MNLKYFTLLSVAAISALVAGQDIKPLIDYDLQDQIISEIEVPKITLPVLDKKPIITKSSMYYTYVQGGVYNFYNNEHEVANIPVVDMRFGYNINEYLSTELMIGTGLIEDEVFENSKLASNIFYGAFIVPKYTIEKLTVYSDVGYLKSDIELDYKSVDLNKWVVGVGLDYKLEDGISLGVNYMYIDNVDLHSNGYHCEDVDVSLVTISVKKSY